MAIDMMLGDRNQKAGAGGAIVFHPGAPKCATTYLQERVFANAPDVACLGRPNHSTPGYQDFKAALLHGEDMQDVERAYDALIGTASDDNALSGKIVISDETIFNVRSHMYVAERLRRCNEDVDILITTRDQRSALTSLYQRHAYKLKDAPRPYSGRHVSFKNWMELVMRKGEPRFDFWKAYQGYAGVFGRDRVHVVPQELLTSDPEEMRRIVSAILGVQISSIDDDTESEINKSHSQRMRHYHRLRSGILYGNSMTRFVPGGSVLRRLKDSYLEQGASSPPKLSDAHIDWIRSSFGPGNRRLAEETNSDFIRNYPID